MEAPAPFAAAMLVEGAGRFALGPLSEVAASTHSWSELAPHAPTGPVAALCAHERVVRGDDLTAFTLDPPVLDLPLRLEPWEPAYPLAEYRSHDAHFPAPVIPRLEPVAAGAPGARIPHPAVEALADLTRAWTVSSDGRVATAAVRGDARAAIAALTAGRVRLAAINGAGVLGHMAWAAASGGAHGRRRGAATARFDAWVAIAAIAGIDAWPPLPDAVGAAVDRLHCVAWDRGEPATGWVLRLAFEDPSTGIACAIDATDAR